MFLIFLVAILVLSMFFGSVLTTISVSLLETQFSLTSSIETLIFMVSYIIVFIIGLLLTILYEITRK